MKTSVQIAPFDIYMCTCNSSETLRVVLTRIMQVIPPEYIHRKFIVDDFSTDNTCMIAASLGWEVFKNHQKGLFYAQAYAKSLVQTPYYASFEHDILLSTIWFNRIPPRVTTGEYSAAQGIRLRDSWGFKEIDLFDSMHRDVKSEDNTFYYAAAKSDKYLVDKTVVSIHMRGSLSKSLRHGYFIYREVNSNKLQQHVKSFIKSFPASLKIAKETKALSPVILYPLERLFFLIGATVNRYFR